jgi:hypothetical protein
MITKPKFVVKPDGSVTGVKPVSKKVKKAQLEAKRAATPRAGTKEWFMLVEPGKRGDSVWVKMEK